MLTDEAKRQWREEKSARHADEKLRDLWLDMLWQLRYGSKEIPHIPPGDCQAVFDYIVEREFKRAGIKYRYPLRHNNTRLALRTMAVSKILAWVPEHQRITRLPHSQDGYPVFLKVSGKILLIDGRRRISVWRDLALEVDKLIWVIAPCD